MQSTLNKPVDLSYYRDKVRPVLARLIKSPKLRSLYRGLSKRNWEPRPLIASDAASFGLSHVAVFVGKGRNAGDVLLPTVLRDIHTANDLTADWKSIHAHDEVDRRTIQEINQSDGLVVGGGGLFIRDSNENCVSGWQWAIPKSLLEQIKVPFCLFGVGYNRFRGQPEFDACFKDSLRTLATKSVFVGLRNTGSMNAVKRYLPEEFHRKIVFQPCMTTMIKKLYPEIVSQATNTTPKILALNCAFDRSELRFGRYIDAVLDRICEGTATLASRFGLVIKYYSHFDRDLRMIEALDRNKIDCEVVDLAGMDHAAIMAEYSKPALAMGMRGHAQMIPFGCGTPIMSLISHDKMKWFLNDVGRPEWGVEVRDEALAENMVTTGSRILDDRQQAIRLINESQDRFWERTRANVERFRCELATSNRKPS